MSTLGNIASQTALTAIQDSGGGNVQILPFDFDGIGAELGIFFLLSTASILLVLNKLDGRVFRMKIFLMNRFYHLVQSPPLVRSLTVFIRMVTWFTVLLPGLALLVWSAALIVKAVTQGDKAAGGICVFLVGSSLLCAAGIYFRFKWNFFQFDWRNAAYFIVMYLCLSAYQFVAVFYPQEKTIFGMNAIFLSANCLVMMLLVFINSAVVDSSIQDVIRLKVPAAAQLGRSPPDENRNQDFQEEVNKQRDDKSYIPSKEDVYDLFTIGRPKFASKGVATAYGAGIQNFVGRLPTLTRRLLSLGLWIIAVIILVVYSFCVAGYFPGGSRGLGFITMIALLTTDVLVFLIQNTGVIKTAVPLCATLLFNRVLLMVFAGDFWVYGYILIYLIYGLMLSHIVAKRRFPISDDAGSFDLEKYTQEQKAKVAASDPAQAGKVQAQAQQNKSLDAIMGINEKVEERLKLIQAPEYPMAIVSLIYLIILLVLSLVKPTNIPLPPLHVANRNVHFFAAFGFITVLVGAFYTALVVGRLFIRRKQGQSQKVYYEFKKVVTLKQLRLDRYWVFIVLNLIFLVGIGIIAWWLTGSWTACTVVIFVDLYLLTALNFYSHYMANDYSLLQDIAAVNARTRLHNQRVDSLKAEITSIKDKLKGPGGQALVGQELLEKASKVLDQQQQPSSPSKAAATQGGEPWSVDTKKQPNSQNSVVGPSQVNVKVQPAKKPQPSEADQLVNEELNNMKKQGGEDGIYEGGEAEVTELFVDPDEEETVDAKKFQVKYKEIPDWRLQGNAFGAFWRGDLRKNDYQLIFSTILALIEVIIAAVIICAITDSSLGVTIVIPFVHYHLAAFSHLRALSTDQPMSLFEYLCFGLAYAVQYGWGIWNLNLTYGMLRKKKLGEAVYPDPGQYIVVNLIVIPFITSCVASILKWIDSKGKLDRFIKAQLIMTGLQGLGMLVCAFIFMTWVQGVVIAVVIGALSYLGFQIWIFQRNEYYMPNHWFYINLGLAFLIVIGAFVVSLCVPGFTVFLGFSISVWLLSGLLFVYGLARVSFDYRHLRTRPVFISPWVFPVYRYDAKKQDVVPHNQPAACLLGALLLMVFWSTLATVWFTPTHVGVALSIIFMLVLTLAVIFLVQVSQAQLRAVFPLIDQKILRRAWLEAKLNYVSNRSVFSRNELVTYEEYTQRKNLFRNKVRLREGRTTLNLEERLEKVEVLADVPDSALQGWLDPQVIDMSKETVCYSFLYELEQEIRKVYLHELELIVMFQLLMIAYSETYSDQKKKFLFAFLSEKRPLLLALDIVINVPPNVPVTVQHAKVVQQITELPPDRFALFTDLRERFVQENRDLDDKRRAQAELEQQKAEERDRNIANRFVQRRETIKDNKNKPVAEWIDCLEKYQKIKEEFAKKPDKFSDSQFAPDAESLGPNLTNRGVEKWIRASQHPEKKCVLFKDTVSALDIKQGALGDCYFLSAISVLGEQNVRQMIRTTEDEWAKLGCFCVRFYREGEEVYVIVDDYFPMRKVEGGKLGWAFASGGDDGEELWPLVLEKAYAKLYGSYQFIEAGKVQYALADMISGFPEQIDLQKEAKNLEVFWEKLKTLKRQGALMGAGTPENPLGDAAINQLGIVQGHAYAILDVQEIDQSKLIKLRNPHGKAGAEWKGDWSDSSTNWNQRAKNKLSYEPRDHEDGVFWMDAFDFQQQFAYLYVCRILSESMGWKKAQLDGEWRGITAEGLPSRSNPSAKLELNPQYEILITKPCDAFVMLQQKEPDPVSNSTFKGKNNIFFMVSMNNGKRVVKLDKDSILARSGNPTNLATITSEADFDSSLTYPQRFTLLVATTAKGKEGEGTFEVKVFSTDPNMKVTPMP